MLEDALFTAPPHPAWSGAALINREGKLVGVGSLIVGEAVSGSDKTPGNMFVPIDQLTTMPSKQSITGDRYTLPAGIWNTTPSVASPSTRTP